MKSWTKYLAGCAVLCTLLLAACTDNEKPAAERDRAGDDASPQPMSRTTPDAGETTGDAADAGDAGMARGKKVYNQYCITCHQANGQGMAGVYPPLEGAEFLKDKQKTIDAVSNGLQGKITVKGKEYNSVMPPIPGNYSDADIAATINYVIQTFGDGSWTTTAAEVGDIRK